MDDYVGIVDTEYYRQLIADLQKKGILISEIKKTAAQILAKKQRVSVKSIPRFKIILPNSISIKAEIERDSDKSDYAKIYVTNLPYTITENQLEEYFTQFGEVSDIAIPKDHYTGKVRGFGFVEFESKEVANKLLQDNEPKYLEGRKIYIQEFKK